MDINVVKIATYYHNPRRRSLGIALEVVGKSYSLNGPFDWYGIHAYGFRVGNWSIRGNAKKNNSGQWQVIQPFMAEEFTRKKELNLTPEKIEELCSLAGNNPEGFVKELANLIGAEMEKESIPEANIFVRTNIKGLTRDRELSIGFEMNDNKYYPRDLFLRNHTIEGLDWNISSAIFFPGSQGRWVVYKLVPERKFELDDCIIQERCECMLDFGLSSTLSKKLREISKEALKTASSGNAKRLEELLKDLKELGEIPLEADNRSLIYEEKDRDFRVSVFHNRIGRISWSIEENGKRIMEGDASDHTGKELLNLIETAIEMGSAKDLQDYCEKLVRGKPKVLRR